MWSLWKFILRRLAQAKGFLDPMVVFSNLQHFSKPSEVWVPVELLRSGAVLQARGLINSQAIQNNLDWVWPFWVERQFNPNDKAFVPRAFSLTHINLTHRNWTAVGLPGVSDFPIVDPCGLVTPFFDGWSLDAWIIHEKSLFVPSRLAQVEQGLDLKDTIAVLTNSKSERFSLGSRVEVKMEKNPTCVVNFHAHAAQASWLLICVRPYNPEGVSFIKDISLLDDEKGWVVNKKDQIFLDQKPFRYIFANYDSGDLWDIKQAAKGPISCKVGMGTSAAVYALGPKQPLQVNIHVPLSHAASNSFSSWESQMQKVAVLEVPDKHFQFLFDASIKAMILHSPGDIYPGPFTYKRFWFRDAAFILQAMMAVGISKNIENIIDRFPSRQTAAGYFMSQDGEWDSNGQAIWAIKRFIDTSNRVIKKEWCESIYKAAKWIERKRQMTHADPAHAGLLPAGFSAEHFGPSDFYYWDDFWAIAGLRDAAQIALSQDHAMAEDFQNQMQDLSNTVENSIALQQNRLSQLGIPASPSRRMDAAAIGPLVASYPLQIYRPDDKRILQTAKFLMDKYFLQGAFYHEISHSGINIYLTLHIAQVLLRAGNPKFFDIVKSTASLATPTGQWPEAIHPRTKGGCMGDGQHVWASAEWVMVVRNMFVREEFSERMLILCSGIPPEWLKPKERISLGPVYTIYGEISVSIKVLEEHVDVSWQARWHQAAPKIEVWLAGHAPYTVKENTTSIKLNRLEVLV